MPDELCCGVLGVAAGECLSLAHGSIGLVRLGGRGLGGCCGTHRERGQVAARGPGEVTVTDGVGA